MWLPTGKDGQAELWKYIPHKQNLDDSDKVTDPSAPKPGELAQSGHCAPPAGGAGAAENLAKNYQNVSHHKRKLENPTAGRSGR